MLFISHINSANRNPYAPDGGPRHRNRSGTRIRGWWARFGDAGRDHLQDLALFVPRRRRGLRADVERGGVLGRSRALERVCDDVRQGGGGGLGGRRARTVSVEHVQLSP